ncbi:MAG: hypothetical protein QM703_13060 [Gemmatales bacterium]
MRQSLTLACLLFSTALLVGQPPANKPLWSTPTTGPCRLLTTTPDGKELFTLNYKVERNNILGLSIGRIDLSNGKELQNYLIEGIDSDELAANSKAWQEARFDATPDGETLLVTLPKPYSSTRQNVYGFNTLQLYDLKTGKKRGEAIPNVVTLSPGAFSESSATCFSPDGKYFWAFTKGFGEQLNIYSCTNGAVAFTIDCTESKGAPQCAAFSADGKRMALCLNKGATNKGSNVNVAIYSWPEGKVQKEFTLPPATTWQMLHSWKGNLAYLESMEEDDKSKAVNAAPSPHPVQAYRRVCSSFDMSADDPLSTLKKESLVGGFGGHSLGLPDIFWDAGPTWIAHYTQHVVNEKVQQAAVGKKPTTYYYWRDAKVMDAQTGKVIFEQKGLPYQTHITRDGRYLITVGASPDLEEGIHVWQLSK